MGRGLAGLVLALALLVVILWVFLTSPDEIGRDLAPKTDVPPSADASAVTTDPQQPVLRGLEAAAPADPIPSAPSDPAEAGIGIRLRGRVVDEARRGVPDVHVALVAEGRSIHETRTAADGAYRFEGSVPASTRVVWMRSSRPAQCECTLRALAADGRTSQRDLVLSERSTTPGDLELRPLVLEEGFPLTLHVTADDGPVAGARVRIGCGPPDHRKSWGWAETVVTDGSGQARVTALPRGTAGVYVRAAGWGPGIGASRVPRAGDTPLEIRLPPRRQVEVQVLEESSEAPVPDAEVSLVVTLPKPDRGWVQLGSAEGIPRTDARGITRIPAFAAECRGWTYVRAPGRPQPTRASHAQVTWADPRTVVRVPAPSTLSWRLIPSDGPLPTDGTQVRVFRGDRIVYSNGFQPPDAGRIEGDRLVIPHAVAQTEHRPYNLIAVLPDGRCALASVARGESQGEEVAFRSPRTLTVQVADPDGKPVAGIGLSLRNCRSSCLHDRIPPTDDRGGCILTPLLPEPVRVGLRGIDAWIERQEQDVDLTAGDRRVEFSVPPPRRLHVRVLVDGEPRLPSTWRLTVGRDRVAGRQIEEDAPTGTLRATLRRNAPLLGSIIRMETDAFGTAVGTAEPDPSTGEAAVTLSLRSGGRILAQVRPPPDGQYELFLERYVDEIHAFSVTALPVPPEAAREGLFEFAGLEAGRYRLRERFTHLVSDVAVVAETGGDVELPFDLRGMGFVRGRVDAPEDAGVVLTRVVVQGLVQSGGPPVPGLLQGDRRTPPNSIPVDENGEFQLHVPGDRTLTLDAWHPVLQSGGTVQLRGPRDDVRLVLRRGPTAILVLDREPTPREAAVLEGSILLFEDDVRGKATWTCPTNVAGREIFFGRFEPGTYTLWLDGGTLAPLLMRGVELGRGSTRIEGARISAGCRLRVEPRLPDGTVQPRLGLAVTSLEGPRYVRSRWLWERSDTLEVSGLGAGRFQVTVHTIEDSDPAPRLIFEQEVELDGVTDVRIPVDLR